MKTLYDLLGALPDDDADGLRAAFRRAAKENHPDFNPDNAEASERFRRIIRANAILSDGQQRAEYDRLLEIAKRQLSQQPRRSSRYGSMRRLAADAFATAAISVVVIGGYLFYKSAERLPLSTAQAIELARLEPAQAVVDKPAEIAALFSRAVHNAQPQAPDNEANSSERDVNLQTADKPAKQDAPASIADGAATANALASPPGDRGAKDIAYYRERGLRAYRSGELHLALANFGVAIDLAPGLPESYIDRGIVFHRLGDLKRALSDVAEAKRIDESNRKHSAQQTSVP